MSVTHAPARRLKRRRRVRAKIHGSAERPRISVFRSNRGIFAQLIDDDSGRTMASVNWTESDLRSLKPMEQATAAGKLLAERAKAAGVESAVFDRGAHALCLLHRLKALDVGLGPVDGGDRAPGDVVDQLRAHAAVRAENRQPRALRGAADLRTYAAATAQALLGLARNGHARLPTFLWTYSPT